MKLLSSFLIFLFTTGGLLAQGKVSLIRVETSVGYFTTQDQSIAENTSAISTAPGIGVSYQGAQPAVFVGIGFYSHKKLEIGMEAGYQYSSINNSEYFGPQGQIFNESISVSSFMVTPKVRMNWILSDDDLFEFYSSLNVGLAFSDYQYSVRTEENGSYPQPTGHLCAAGLRFGKKFGGFMEIGIGNKGLMNFGLSYRL